jgi:hypothetical protein
MGVDLVKELKRDVASGLVCRRLSQKAAAAFMSEGEENLSTFECCHWVFNTNRLNSLSAIIL